MSMKAISQAVKNVEFAGAMGAISEEKHNKYYGHIKNNADALALLGIFDWCEAFDMLSDIYYESKKEKMELNKEIKEIKEILSARA